MPSQPAKRTTPPRRPTRRPDAPDPITTPPAPTLPPAPVPATLSERIASGMMRASAGEGHAVGAIAHLREAGEHERLASQYRDQVAAVRAAQGTTPRGSVRVSHLCQALKRAEASAEKSLAQAEDCLRAPHSPA